ncbi:MAG: acetylglutamate kinase [Candidatus Ratteibacteria bacterium]
MEDGVIKKAEILVEALPYIQKYQGKVFVVKVGGSLLRSPETFENVLLDIAFLHAVGLKIVIVSGGGPFINEELEKQEKEIHFVEGLRVTNEEVLNVVVDVLEKVRNDIVQALQEKFHSSAHSLSPVDGILMAKKIHWQKGAEVIDLGFVGEVSEVNVDLLYSVLEKNIAVISSIGLSEEGTLFNINGDSVAASIACNIVAEKMIFVSNVRGVMRNPDNSDTLISTLNADQVDLLIKDGVIQQGMIPKVRAAMECLNAGVKKVHIVGGVPHAMLLEIFTSEGVGTEILLEERRNHE